MRALTSTYTCHVMTTLAQVIVGNFESEVSQIEYAGIPQGSPLSPLLYVFYNADLVEWKIDGAGGALGFVDDFNAWAVGDNAAQNIKTIQDTIIPHAEQRATRSGATFEADKTSLIHFTRRQTDEEPPNLRFCEVDVTPSPSVKVLGVTLDVKLALPILEAEASIESTKARLTRKVTAQAVKLLTLPIENPVRRAIVHAQGVRRYASPLDTTLSAVTGRLKHIARRPLSANPPWIHATWVSLGRRVLIVDKDQAIHDANAIANAGIASLYSDASVTAPGWLPTNQLQL
jgi:hypothetical protein